MFVGIEMFLFSNSSDIPINFIAIEGGGFGEGFEFYNNFIG